MKLTAIAIQKWNGANKEATSLGLAADVSSYGYFQRGPVQQMMAFVSRTVAQRTLPGQRQSVQQSSQKGASFILGGCASLQGASRGRAQQAAKASIVRRPDRYASLHFCNAKMQKNLLTIQIRLLVAAQEACVDDYFCHAHNQNGLVGIVFVDKDYPVRSAFCVVNKVLDDFTTIHAEKWRSATEDSTVADSMLGPALQKFQDPNAADKLAKIQSDLDETKVVLHRTIESMLERGEKLDTLVGKSEDLSMASQMFYNQARKTNSCCKLM